MLHLWLHLKSDDWVRWREGQDRRGVGDPAAAGSAASAAAAAAESTPNATRAASAGSGASTSGSSSATAHIPARKSPNLESTHAATGSQHDVGSQHNGAAAAAAVAAIPSKNSVSPKTKSGGCSRWKGAETGSDGGVPESAGSRSKIKRVRYRLDGEHDRILADWEEPARKALQVRCL